MSINADNYNLEFLLKFNGDRSINMNLRGELYVIEDSPKIALSETILEQEDTLRHIHNIAQRALKARMQDHLDLSLDPTQKDYSALLGRFAEINLISESQKVELAFAWYDARYEELLELYDGIELFAEAHVAYEMACDRNIPEIIRKKMAPFPVDTGINGSYFLKNRDGEIVGIFKPREQEYGMYFNPKKFAKVSDSLRKGHIPGTSWKREIAAYEIDDGFIGVPQTTEMALYFPGQVGGKGEVLYEMQLGSFQAYVPNAKNFLAIPNSVVKNIPDLKIQIIALFDLLTIMGDRNFTNFLFKGDLTKPEEAVLIPIDNGLAFQNEFEFSLDWLALPQLKKPIHTDLINWLLNFDIDISCAKLKGLHLEKEAIFNHKIMHAFLVNEIKKGKTLYEIAVACNKNDDDVSLLDTKMQMTKKSLSEGGNDTNNEDVFLNKFREILERS